MIGLDLGTTTISGVLLDAAGAPIHVARRRVDAGVSSARPTRAEQDPTRLTALALDVLAELAAAGGPVDGIALTGQMHGLLCTDARGQPLTPLITWQDRRTAEPLPDGTTTLERLRTRVADLDWRPNGCRIHHGYGAATLFWLVEQDALPPDTRYVTTLAGWLAARLCGRPPATDPTFAASWGIYDLLAGTWSAALLNRLGLDLSLLPPVWPSSAPLRELAPAVAEQVGLPAGVPVLNPIGDNQASFLGATLQFTPGVNLAGQRAQADVPGGIVLVNLGTGGQVSWAVPAFEPPTERVETRPLPGGGALRVGASLCGGGAYAWLADTVRAWLAEFGLEIETAALYQHLNGLARACDDTGSLRVRPTFLGVRGASGVDGGAIEGITPDNMRLGSLARATLEGIVDELYDLYATHRGRAAGGQRVVAAGGAVERNPLLLALLSRRFALPVEMAKSQEAAALGACTGPGLPEAPA
ncbi:MAG: FGGY family carbohydrate kinase [Anaerolineae bacterium]